MVWDVEVGFHLAGSVPTRACSEISKRMSFHHEDEARSYCGSGGGGMEQILAINPG
jgi:hypothetical protein